jgi:hypothetical protein
MGSVWIALPAHDQANRFKAVASLGTVDTVFRVCRLPETTTFRFYIRTMPTAPARRDSQPETAPGDKIGAGKIHSDKLHPKT